LKIETCQQLQALLRQQQAWMQTDIVKAFLSQSDREAVTWWSKMSGYVRKVTGMAQLTLALESFDDKIKRVTNRIKTLKKQNSEREAKGETPVDIPDKPISTASSSEVMAALEQCKLADVSINTHIQCSKGMCCTSLWFVDRSFCWVLSFGSRRRRCYGWRQWRRGSHGHRVSCVFVRAQ
jgi:hypothetical protein